MAELPLFLQEQTEENIMQRMLERVPSDIDKSEGSFIWDAQAPVAFVLAEAAGWAQQVLERGFAGSTFGAYLDLRVSEHGLTRREAVRATGTVRFAGVPGTLVPAGTVVATPADEVTSESSIEYVTKQAIALDADGIGEGSIQAVLAGRQGNVPEGVITVLGERVPGISTVTNPASIRGGADIESDELLLERYYAHVRNQGTSANKAHYLKWAGEVPGVGAVQVQPLWQGPGTVGIYLLDTEKRAANAELVTAVQQVLDPTQDGQGEGAAPAGAVVTVMAAEEVPIKLSVKLTLIAGTDLVGVKKQITEGLRAYLQGLAFADSAVRMTRVAAILLDLPGIVDYTQLQMNGSDEPVITVELGQVAVPGLVDAYE